MTTTAPAPAVSEAAIDAKAEEVMVTEPVESLSEEKKQADPGEEDGAVEVKNPFDQSAEGSSGNGEATHEHEEDSSNDDSSYFADPSNLPSPGEAGRKYSYGSHASAKKNTHGSRESDASLSLSDDSDDENPSNNNPMYVQQAPEVFPQQRITRMHSVGSLVSTSSQNSEDAPNIQRELNQYQLSHGYPHPQPQMMAPMGAQQWMTQQSNVPPHMHPGGNGFADGSMPFSEVGPGQPNGGMIPNGGNNKADGKKSGRHDTRNKNKSLDFKPESSDDPAPEGGHPDDEHFKVYWGRWVMLMYMSLLNLLSDWTCYSVAPIALLTQEAFGEIDPEQLVTIFLAANAVASGCEPIILSRLGLRRTVLFGALLLMVGSIIKSGGMPPIVASDLEKGHGEWRVYVGFFLVGLSQPLYQCTPALLSASWFPENERTMATGVALNANQLGIGFAFIFGTLLVADSDDIPQYFGVLSIISTITFFGTLFQFEDAPPTPPSDSARVMRGTLEVDLPSVKTILQSIGVGNNADMQRDIDEAMKDDKKSKSSKSRSASGKARKSGRSSTRRSRGSGGPPTAEGGRRKSRASRSKPESTEPQAPPPSAALFGSVTDIVAAPSPMMPGNVGGAPIPDESEGERRPGEPMAMSGYPYGPPPVYSGVPMGVPPMPPMGYPAPSYGAPQGIPGYGSYPPQGYPAQGYPGYQMQGYYDPRYQQYAYPQGQQQFAQPPQPTYGGSYQHQPPRPDQALYRDPYSVLPPVDGVDAGAEPVLTITPHHLDIDIRDDQIILAIRACFARPGFIHSLVSFTVSGIVINTLSTYMDYLVRLNGAGREYTGIVGGSFQVVIMISSLIIGGLCDKSRAYYSVAIAMLVIGAFGLAECGVSLNADRGSDLRVALIVVAALVGPLQPISTELGVEVVYPLSENTVLVIQQLFSNLLSALFIPVFKELKDIGISQDESGVEQPEYTFSFYLLIVLHAAATVFFATFNGRYLRYEHELQKKDQKDQRKKARQSAAAQDADGNASVASMGSFQPSLMSGAEGYGSSEVERQPLVPQHTIV
eukprot:CAMPEP_0172444332 /NCGR_PEP_ID=MMETSP1065-20121228/4383_1 /TAXON_ID=265537 /ORGANISM="Amphiprora paludosa, Strain CCMP125" /LENGTH=1048 /DNA_ID=CAMNT_0013194821 /DNA_START=135 /DNA_END=3281 /DNA_ORIENTATION=+